LFLGYHPIKEENKKLTEDLTAQWKVVVAQIPRKPSIPNKKVKMGFNHIPIYE